MSELDYPIGIMDCIRQILPFPSKLPCLLALLLNSLKPALQLSFECTAEACTESMNAVRQVTQQVRSSGEFAEYDSLLVLDFFKSLQGSELMGLHVTVLYCCFNQVGV